MIWFLIGIGTPIAAILFILLASTWAAVEMGVTNEKERRKNDTL